LNFASFSIQIKIIMRHLTNWTEIPVSDISRAIRFYTEILGTDFFEMEMGGNKYALFPSKDKFNTGALVQGDWYKPAADGVTVYLDGGTDVGNILGKIENAGGTILLNKTYLGEQAGFIGLFLDSEGNRIGVQAI
jgi:uncharacterized protein